MNIIHIILISTNLIHVRAALLPHTGCVPPKVPNHWPTMHILHIYINKSVVTSVPNLMSRPGFRRIKRPFLFDITHYIYIYYFTYSRIRRHVRPADFSGINGPFLIRIQGFFHENLYHIYISTTPTSRPSHIRRNVRVFEDQPALLIAYKTSFMRIQGSFDWVYIYICINEPDVTSVPPAVESSTRPF